MLAVGKRVYFAATVLAAAGGKGRELYVSDGTAAGTRLLCDIRTGAASSNPTELVLSSGRLFFAAKAFETGNELRTVTLPGASTKLIGQACAPHLPTMRATLPTLNATATLSGATVRACT